MPLYSRVLLIGALSVSTMVVAEDDPLAFGGLDTLVVNASRMSQSIEDTTVPVTVVGREELDRRQARDLSDVLGDIPGATAASGPRRDALMPSIRGLSDGRVVVRINGARQNFQLNHRGQTFIEPTLLSRAEVLRGPGSALFGSGAIGGVVNFSTLDARDLLYRETGTGGQISLGYGSINQERRLSTTLAATDDTLDILASVTRSVSDDYRDGDGDTIDFSASDITSGLVTAGWNPDRHTRLTMNYLAFEDDSKSRTTADRPRGDEVNRQTRQQTFTLGYQSNPDNDLQDMDVTVYLTDLNQREENQENGTVTRNNLQTLGFDGFNTSRFSTGEVYHQLTYGLESFRDRQEGRENRVERLGFSDARQDTVGVFIQDQMMLTDRTDLTVGARYDRIRQRADREGTEGVNYYAFSPQATLAYQVGGGFGVFASYAEAFRAPGLRELYVGGQHFPGNEFIPNPDLKAEEAANKEVGITYFDRGVLASNDRLRGQLSVFQNDIDDFVQQLVRGDDAPPGLENTTRFENVAKARLRGAEFELAYEHPDHRINVAVTHLRGNDRNGDQPLEGIAGDDISVSYARLLTDRNLELGVRGLLVAGQDRLPETTDPDAPEPSAGYGTMDVFASWSPTVSVSTNLRLDNVFDRTFRRGNALVNSPGRNVRLSAVYRF
ncbi:MAG: TonB-dependent hemoglobin/transferrin/lactoferrin family receptor [Halomonadaceae bacterium]|nr:MAG: TonB-dependent hemoglobin/transferrin/lactoferrin family receptor [Halomonadaceae bacterium]